MEKEDEEMKRLTVRIDGLAHCLERYQNKHCNVKRCGSCEINDEIHEKLADYEDTGMTPEQVIEMQMGALLPGCHCRNHIGGDQVTEQKGEQSV